MQVLGKMSDAVGKLGGAQVSYRLASVRQELQVDKEYAEFLQAEARRPEPDDKWSQQLRQRRALQGLR